MACTNSRWWYLRSKVNDQTGITLNCDDSDWYHKQSWFSIKQHHKGSWMIGRLCNQTLSHLIKPVEGGDICEARSVITWLAQVTTIRAGFAQNYQKTSQSVFQDPPTLQKQVLHMPKWHAIFRAQSNDNQNIMQDEDCDRQTNQP
jgi:hypothetical protein